MDNHHVVCIHQPPFAPWLGLVECMFAVDHFVIYDDVQFEKGGIQNRNKIKTQKGTEWITIPVSVKSETPLNKVQLSPSYSPGTIIKTLQSSYGRTPYFKEIMPDIEAILNVYAPGDLLCDLNIKMLKWISEKLNCPCQFVRSSEIEKTAQTRLGRIGEICRHLKATHLYTGTGMLAYCSPEDIVEVGVIPIFHNYQNRHPTYKQRFEQAGFVPCLSILDFLFNVGYAQASEELSSSAKMILSKAFESKTIFFSS